MLFRSQHSDLRRGNFVAYMYQEAEDFDIPESVDMSDSAQVSIRNMEFLELAAPRLQDNPILRLFFEFVLVEGGGFDELHKNAEFQALLAQYPSYAKLNLSDLGEKLQSEARGLIVEGLLEISGNSIAPALAEFMRWHFVEGKPLRGKDGLFNRKSFKTMLTTDDRLSGVNIEYLAETLNEQALSLLHEWFDS